MKKYLWMLSAAVVIGALRVNSSSANNADLQHFNSSYFKLPVYHTESSKTKGQTE